MRYPHGSPADRGAADRWYGRPARPHYNAGHRRVEDLTEAQTAEYYEAYRTEEQGEFYDDYKWDEPDDEGEW